VSLGVGVTQAPLVGLGVVVGLGLSVGVGDADGVSLSVGIGVGVVVGLVLSVGVGVTQPGAGVPLPCPCPPLDTPPAPELGRCVWCGEVVGDGDAEGDELRDGTGWEWPPLPLAATPTEAPTTSTTAQALPTAYVMRRCRRIW
jgi:hypothetical protein